MGSDWNDIGAVVDHLRALRRVDKVSLVAWSQGGPRAGGYAARNPDEGGAAGRAGACLQPRGPLDAPNPLPAGNGSMNAQSHADFTANWDRQVGCPDQYEPAASAAVWSEMLASDPVGATWGTGVRRAPQVPTWGFNQAIVAKMQTPILMVAGAHDKQVTPERVRELYADLGLEAEGVRRPRLLVPQRDVGEESSAAVQGVARVAEGWQGERHVRRRIEARLLNQTSLRNADALHRLEFREIERRHGGPQCIEVNALTFGGDDEAVADDDVVLVRAAGL